MLKEPRGRSGGIVMSAQQPGSEEELVARLRRGDESAFRDFISRHHGNMIGLALSYVQVRATAEEVVQDTWLAAIERLRQFEGRSSLKTWVFAILTNKAQTRAVRDGRISLFSEIDSELASDDPAVDPARFTPAGSWRTPPRAFDEITPERIAADRELLLHIRSALDNLPKAQRAVIILRDVEGLSPDEVCNILGISESNHRVLLHRGRAKLRNHLETLLAPKGATS